MRALPKMQSYDSKAFNAMGAAILAKHVSSGEGSFIIKLILQSVKII